MPRPKKKNSKDPYFGLSGADVSIGKRGIYEDEDYKSRLSDNELKWLAEFNQGYYNGVFYKPGSRDAMLGGPKFKKYSRTRKEIQREHFVRKRDVWNIIAAYKGNRPEALDINDGRFPDNNQGDCITIDDVLDLINELRKTCKDDAAVEKRISEILFPEEPKTKRKSKKGNGKKTNK